MLSVLCSCGRSLYIRDIRSRIWLSYRYANPLLPKQELWQEALLQLRIAEFEYRRDAKCHAGGEGGRWTRQS